MRQDLLLKDHCYSSSGVFHTLGTNEIIKPCPERFQEYTDPFDVIFSCAERVYKMVVKDLCAREQKTWQPVHVINLDIKDTLKAASLGASIICELCRVSSRLMTCKAVWLSCSRQQSRKQEGAFCIQSASTEDLRWLLAPLSVRILV